MCYPKGARGLPRSGRRKTVRCHLPLKTSDASPIPRHKTLCVWAQGSRIRRMSQVSWRVNAMGYLLRSPPESLKASFLDVWAGFRKMRLSGGCIHDRQWSKVALVQRRAASVFLTLPPYSPCFRSCRRLVGGAGFYTLAVMAGVDAFFPTPFADERKSVCVGIAVETGFHLAKLQACR